MLLDTNAISAWAEQEPGLLAVLRPDRPWYLPCIALGEYQFGVLNSTPARGSGALAGGHRVRLCGVRARCFDGARTRRFRITTSGSPRSRSSTASKW